ncbi:SDR family oxidoreductase [Devosia nitrariae]|uniref:SDR family oxidoreductase n=1 Tax=Devosia nitrariae TaxID=2071872 RepID=A0ABQ5W352_9HYPH|nr:SDR family oxidoreductase [Devosia nitrariae]GLQ54489.1 SDR family oxidoreductase [Devosia nitrariae]
MTAAPFSLEGKTALITGAGGGIGRALVSACREAGAAVVGADREAAMLDGLDLASRVVCDLSDTAATQMAVRDHLAAHGAPDILVSNAGFTRAETIEQVDMAVWESELAINLNGAYAVAAPIIEAMAARGAGSVVFIASVNGLAHFGNPAYSAAKAGLIAYARAIALERGHRGVRANVVCPGSVRTPAWDHRLEKNPTLLDKVLPHYPLGRLVSPQEVANAVIFFASDASSGITGTTLAVDAGLTAGYMRFVSDLLTQEN